MPEFCFEGVPTTEKRLVEKRVGPHESHAAFFFALHIRNCCGISLDRAARVEVAAREVCPPNF